MSALRLCRPRVGGSCWLALKLWETLELDRFWHARLPASRKGTRWDQVLFVLVVYRLLSPGSEWRLHRQWFDRSALADLLGSDASVAHIDTLYACHDRCSALRALFDHLVAGGICSTSFDVLLYDLTSTYFEANPPFEEEGLQQFGHSRDHRPDCVQVVIALVVTPEGLAYDVLQYQRQPYAAGISRSHRASVRQGTLWVMDRGIPAGIRAHARLGSWHYLGATEGPAVTIGEGSAPAAVAGSATGGGGQTTAPGWRDVCVRQEP
jgi:hypothetical protein